SSAHRGRESSAPPRSCSPHPSDWPWVSAGGEPASPADSATSLGSSLADAVQESGIRSLGSRFRCLFQTRRTLPSGLSFDVSRSRILAVGRNRGLATDNGTRCARDQSATPRVRASLTAR